MWARVPVEVLALDLDVAHAIARLALALLAAGLLLAGAHDCCVRVCVSGGGSSFPVVVKAGGWESDGLFSRDELFLSCGHPSAAWQRFWRPTMEPPHRARSIAAAAPPPRASSSSTAAAPLEVLHHRRHAAQDARPRPVGLVGARLLPRRPRLLLNARRRSPRAPVAQLHRRPQARAAHVPAGPQPQGPPAHPT